MTADMAGGKNPPKATWLEQWSIVLQLAKDRKNKYGGITQSIKEFDEMGAHGREHWPLCAESIKREFGVWRDKGDPESMYVEHVEAASHQLLENAVEKLRRTSPDLARAFDNVFSPDLGADRDYDWLKAKAREAEKAIEHAEEAAAIAKAQITKAEKADPPRQPDPRLIQSYRNALHQAKLVSGWPRMLSQVESALVLLTYELWHEDLIVEFARQRTLREEMKMEQRHRDIYTLYRNVTDPPPDGHGNSANSAYELIKSNWGLERSRAEEIVKFQHEEVTGEKRKPGRPKKKK